MGSAYTDNNKFEKIGTGEQAGTWGTTTNLNFDMIDRAINGVKTITLTGSASSLTTSDGALTDGLFKVLQFAGTLSHFIQLQLVQMMLKNYILLIIIVELQ